MCIYIYISLSLSLSRSLLIQVIEDHSGSINRQLPGADIKMVRFSRIYSIRIYVGRWALRFRSFSVGVNGDNGLGLISASGVQG